MTSRDCQFFNLELWFELWQVIEEQSRATSYVGKPSFAYYQLCERYQEPQRQYHILTHIDDGVAIWFNVFHLFCRPYAALLGWLYHDSIYRVMQLDNELKSASELVRVYESDMRLDRYDPMLTWAIHHIKSTDHRSLSSSDDTKLVCDIDLFSLAATPELFAMNTEKIRLEYRQLSDQDFYLGRADFLEELSQRGIFQHPYFRPYEASAQENIAHSVAKWRKQFD